MEWHDVFMTVLMLVVGLLGMPITQWLKDQLKLSGTYALLITGTVSAALAVGELFLMGQLTIDSFTVQNFTHAFGLIFSVATVWYRVLQEGKKL